MLILSFNLLFFLEIPRIRQVKVMFCVYCTLLRIVGESQSDLLLISKLFAKPAKTM